SLSLPHTHTHTHTAFTTTPRTVTLSSPLSLNLPHGHFGISGDVMLKSAQLPCLTAGIHTIPSASDFLARLRKLHQQTQRIFQEVYEESDLCGTRQATQEIR
ncbi:hypothetical protein OTU49_005886, partial [Cherax quadricarinatus]